MGEIVTQGACRHVYREIVLKPIYKDRCVLYTPAITPQVALVCMGCLGIQREYFVSIKQVFDSPTQVKEAMSKQKYIASDEIGTTVFLTDQLGKPLLPPCP